MSYYSTNLMLLSVRLLTGAFDDWSIFLCNHCHLYI